MNPPEDGYIQLSDQDRLAGFLEEARRVAMKMKNEAAIPGRIVEILNRIEGAIQRTRVLDAD